MRLHSRALVPVLVVAIGLLACSDGPTSSETGVSDPQFGRGGGKKPGLPEDRPITVTFHDRLGDNIASDGRGTYETGCNVSARFNINDAILNLKNRIKKQEQEACGYPRYMSVAYVDRVGGSPPGPQDGQTVEGKFMNVDHVETVELSDGTVQKEAHFQMPGCGLGLKFAASFSEEGGIQVSDLDVTKISDDTWTIATRAFPDNIAVCVPSTKGVERSYYHMPVALTVKLQP
jgi:hypothetical protein